MRNLVMMLEKPSYLGFPRVIAKFLVVRSLSLMYRTFQLWNWYACNVLVFIELIQNFVSLGLWRFVMNIAGNIATQASFQMLPILMLFEII